MNITLEHNESLYISFVDSEEVFEVIYDMVQVSDKNAQKAKIRIEQTNAGNHEWRDDTLYDEFAG